MSLYDRAVVDESLRRALAYAMDAPEKHGGPPAPPAEKPVPRRPKPPLRKRVKRAIEQLGKAVFPATEQSLYDRVFLEDLEKRGYRPAPGERRLPRPGRMHRATFVSSMTPAQRAQVPREMALDRAREALRIRKKKERGSWDLTKIRPKGSGSREQEARRRDIEGEREEKEDKPRLRDEPGAAAATLSGAGQKVPGDLPPRHRGRMLMKVLTDPELSKKRRRLLR